MCFDLLLDVAVCREMDSFTDWTNQKELNAYYIVRGQIMYVSIVCE